MSEEKLEHIQEGDYLLVDTLFTGEKIRGPVSFYKDEDKTIVLVPSTHPVYHGSIAVSLRQILAIYRDGKEVVKFV